MANDAGVRIRLLGGFEVTVADRPVAPDAWRLRKARTLVKLLALAGGHRMHREALTAVLWPDRDAGSANNNLHQALHAARRALAGAPNLCSLRDGVVLLSEGEPFWLDTTAWRMWHDPLKRRPCDEGVAQCRDRSGSGSWWCSRCW